MRTRRLRPAFDIWPGFVDALATLLMVILFVLLAFVLAQFFLGNALSGREQALARLTQDMAQLSSELALVQKTNADLEQEKAKLSAQLTRSDQNAERLTHEVAALAALKAQLEARIGELDLALVQAQKDSQDERKASQDARAELALMTQQLSTMRGELARLAAALDVSEKLVGQQKTEITNLGQRLNTALLGKVEELQKFRSEFFGQLKKALGNRPGIRVEGDRFVFQSELLFDTGSAELGPEGLAQVRSLARTLSDISRQIPPDVPWVLRVDGHTDRRPITNSRFPSNWELSTARAMTVIRTLILAGIPADRLAAAGFGEFQPVDKGDSEAAWQKNRRIELRIDAR